MKSSRSLALAVAALACASICQARPPIHLLHPAEKVGGAPVLEAGSAVAATDLTASHECRDDRERASTVVLEWSPQIGATGAQRVDVSRFRTGFDSGDFEVTEALAPEVAAIGLDTPEPGIYYYWRVLSAAPEGWLPSAVERFEGPTCPWDQPLLDPNDFPGAAGAGDDSNGSSR